MSFILTKPDGEKMPRTIQRPVVAGSDFQQGALLLVNGSDEFAECGADPASIAAVAASGAGPDNTGFNILGERGFPPGYVQGHAVQNEQLFHAEYVGTLPAVAGGSYGVVKDADGKWKVDFAETINTRVKLVDLSWTAAPLNVPRVVVSFLAANVQVVG